MNMHLYRKIPLRDQLYATMNMVNTVVCYYNTLESW